MSQKNHLDFVKYFQLVNKLFNIIFNINLFANLFTIYTDAIYEGKKKSLNNTIKFTFMIYLSKYQKIVFTLEVFKNIEKRTNERYSAVLYIYGYLSMVYFWTYAHPSYCPSDLLARGFTAARWTSGRSARPPSLSCHGARPPSPS